MTWQLPGTSSSGLAELEPCLIMGRGHSGTRVLAFLCVHLGARLNTSVDQPSGDVADTGLKRTIKKVALSSLDGSRGYVVSDRNLRRFQKAAARFHRILNPGEAPWGWKFPETYLVGPYVEAIFPKAKYLHLIRDGRDVAFKRHLTDRPEKRLGRRVLELARALGLPHHLQAAASWSWQVEQFQGFIDGVPEDRKIDLRFEDLCQHPLKEAERVADFMGVPMTRECEEFVTRFVDADMVAQYRHEPPEQVREVEDLIGPTLERHGYGLRRASSA